MFRELLTQNSSCPADEFKLLARKKCAKSGKVCQRNSCILLNNALVIISNSDIRDRNNMCNCYKIWTYIYTMYLAVLIIYYVEYNGRFDLARLGVAGANP